jgi:hypothetical protein
VGGVVGPRAGDDGGVRRALGAGELDDAQVLLVGQRRGLPGRAARDHAVRAVLADVAVQRDEGLLVDA